jgi:hypothetical protein
VVPYPLPLTWIPTAQNEGQETGPGLGDSEPRLPEETKAEDKEGGNCRQRGERRGGRVVDGRKSLRLLAEEWGHGIRLSPPLCIQSEVGVT